MVEHRSQCLEPKSWGGAHTAGEDTGVLHSAMAQVDQPEALSLAGCLAGGHTGAACSEPLVSRCRWKAVDHLMAATRKVGDRILVCGLDPSNEAAIAVDRDAVVSAGMEPV